MKSLFLLAQGEKTCADAIATLLKKGCATRVEIAKSLDDDMLKGRTPNRNPFIGRVTKREVYGGWQVGTDYIKSVDAESVRQGGEGGAERKAVWHTFYNEFFNTDKKSQSKYYLQMQRSQKMGAAITTTYYLDGNEVKKDSEVWAAIKEWLKPKKHTMSSTQREVGLTESEERHYMLVSLANIVSITQGAALITLK